MAEESVCLCPEFELATSDMLVQFALRNLGIASVVRDFAEDYLKKGELFVLAFARTIPARSLAIVTDARIPISAAAKTLLGFLGQEESLYKK